ncbi:hypothetical protein [Rhizobium sp. YTUHZ045]
MTATHLFAGVLKKAIEAEAQEYDHEYRQENGCYVVHHDVHQ